MLGDKISELTRKVTSTQVLPDDDYRHVTIEISSEHSKARCSGEPARKVG
jgi:hypothetical protein